MEVDLVLGRLYWNQSHIQLKAPFPLKAMEE